eukprot:2788964-Alexandrium_andersonii.AAC.1
MLMRTASPMLRTEVAGWQRETRKPESGRPKCRKPGTATMENVEPCRAGAPLPARQAVSAAM